MTRLRCLLALLGLFPSRLMGQGAVLVDTLPGTAPWTSYASDGVSIAVTREAGATRADVDYHGGAGYAVLHRNVRLPLADNYRFRFRLRGSLPPNTVEFKLLDSTGTNVWWSVRRQFRFGSTWATVEVPRRAVSFAWGPRGGGTLARAAAVEIAVTAGEGGAGTVWLDSLTYEARPPVDTTWPIAPDKVHAIPASATVGRAMDGDTATAWQVPPGVLAYLVADLGHLRAFGAARFIWTPGEAPKSYAVETSDDGVRWRRIYRGDGADGGRDYLFTGPQEARWVRVAVQPARDGHGIALRELTLLPQAFGTDSNRVIEQMAHDARRGLFPRSFTDSLGFWTVTGADADTHEALVEETGRVGIDQAGFSIEPFLRVGDSLLTWADAEITDSLVQGDLPMPMAIWQAAGIQLATAAWADGPAGRSSLVIRYRVTNPGHAARRVALLLAFRPLQVNPPTQFLNNPGGLGHIASLTMEPRAVLVDSMPVRLLTAADSAGASAFDSGDIGAWLSRGVFPPARHVRDDRRLASGVVAFDATLAAGETREVAVAVPWHPGSRIPSSAGPAWVDSSFAATRQDWDSAMPGFQLDGPPEVEELARTVRASVGYILVNRDSAAIQPGSRAYARSWIRDGALTSSALLRLGLMQPVREFLAWFAPFQFASGKVPCCVDRRGADPVPENDSHGEFIYLAAEYLRHTGDTALVRTLWPRLRRAAGYIDSLSHARMTGPWVDSLGGAFYGLVPESISHEGYSAHPEHSYWDDFWSARGLADAAFLGAALGSPDSARWRAVADSFRHDLLRSIPLAMRAHEISYIPGSVELGDFDATSTTIAGDPAGLLDSLPRYAVERTFARFDSILDARRHGGAWDAYTPYEARAVGAKVRLGWRDAAAAQLRDLLADRRPPAWRQWPEVIRHPMRARQFLGDLPHTWVASDFIRSVLDVFAYEAGGTLVLMQGVPSAWLDGGGIVVRIPWGAPGPIAYRARRVGTRLVVELQSLPADVRALRLVPPAGNAYELRIGSRVYRGGAAGVTLPRQQGRVEITPLRR